MASYCGVAPDNIFREQKTRRKTDAKRKQESSNMWFKGNKFQVNNLVQEYKMQSHKEQQNIKHHIGSAAGSITKRVQRHQSFKGRI